MTDIDKQTISKLHKLLVKKTISPRELLQETVKKALEKTPRRKPISNLIIVT